MYSKEGWQGLHSALAGIMKDKNEKQAENRRTNSVDRTNENFQHMTAQLK